MDKAIPMFYLRKYIFYGIKLIIPFVLFAIFLSIKISQSFSRNFFSYSAILFIVILFFLFLTFRLPPKYHFITFTLVLFIFAMTLSYKWTSGFSDNGIIGGLLPYKDGKSYYGGALLILNGEQLNAGRSTWRPLFPAFLSSLHWFTGQNLKLTLAVLVALAGMGSFFSAQEIFKTWGAIPASLYTAFLYFYAQYFIGEINTELLGLTMGCFAFILLFRAANHPRWFDVTLGLITLVIALSARAGAFFILPLLVLWVGWIFREKERFSSHAALISMVIIFLSYLFGNTLLHHLIGAETDLSFGNFAYSLYGQVRGGTGWHSAIEALGTRDTSKVYEAAINYFINHPFSFVLASLKSYRDFFLPGATGIFIFDVVGRQVFLNNVLWFSSLGLLAVGLIGLGKRIRSNVSSLLIVSFAGLLLSIPFLPPIDGGSRFYASTMPFFFALVSVGTGKFSLANNKSIKEALYSSYTSDKLWIISVILVLLAVPLPILNRFLQKSEEISIPECDIGQSPFVVRVNAGSYIDILRDQEAKCGMVPGVCYRDFNKNGKEKGVDDFYDRLLLLAGSSGMGIRVIPTYNLIDWNFHYFVQDIDQVSIRLDSPTINGCATKIWARNQSIYLIESVLSSE